MHLKVQISRELDWLELLLEQIKAVASADAAALLGETGNYGVKASTDERGSYAEADTADLRTAADALERRLRVLTASSDAEIEVAFAAAVVDIDPFLFGRRVQLAIVAARHGVPTIYPLRDYVAAGGLMSYGANFANAWRQAGAYAGRILNGAKPADLPVVLPTKFELVINLKAAKTLGLDIPPKLLALADEVIE